MKRSNKIALMLASCSAMAIAAPVWAQDTTQPPPSPAQTGAAEATGTAPPTTTGVAAQAADVVVTAQKRSERLHDVPLSVVVANQAQLQSEEVNQIADLNQITPSLEMQQASGQNPGGGGQIRGLGTQTFAIGAVGAVGVVVDQVSQGNANITDLYDVSQVEVLKGPQGTLFGLTTSAGVINITTNAPDPSHYSGAIHTELSNAGTAGSEYGQQIIQGVVNIPLSSDSALRVAGNIDTRQGVDYDVTTGTYTQHQDYSLRARYLWEPTSNLQVNLIGDYTHTNDLGADFFTDTMASPGDTAALEACGVVPEPGNRDYCEIRPESNPTNNYGGSARIDYDFGPVKLTSITQDREDDGGPADSSIFRQVDNPTQIFTLGATNQSNLFTEEVRLASPSGSRFEYTIGGFYSRYTTSNGGGGINVEVVIPPGTPGFPPGGLTIPEVTDGGAYGHLLDTSGAVFGQGTFHVTDQFRLIFGARYTNETLTTHSTTNTAPFVPIPNDAGSVTENNFSWKVGAQYDINKNVMAYVLVATGYKGPTLNNSNPLAPPTVINPELPIDYEGGIKTTFLDGRLAADLSIWYTDDKGFQGQQCLPVPTGLACGPVNYSSVVSDGVELDVYGRPLPGLSVNTGLIYNPVKYPAGTLASDGSGDLGGQQLGNAPLWKFTFSSEYDHPITEKMDGFISVNAVYKSDLDLDNSNDPNLHFPAHWIWGGQLGLRFDNNKYDIALFARNIGNVHEPVLIFPNFPNGPPEGPPNADYGTYYAPQSFRLVGVILDARF